MTGLDVLVSGFSSLSEFGYIRSTVLQLLYFLKAVVSEFSVGSGRLVSQPPITGCLFGLRVDSHRSNGLSELIADRRLDLREE